MRDGVKGKFEEFDFVLDLRIVEGGRYLYLHDYLSAGSSPKIGNMEEK